VPSVLKEPDPDHFGLEDSHAPGAEEAVGPDGGDLERPERQEVTAAVEGREKRDTEPAVGHRVEEAMGRPAQKEEDADSEPSPAPGRRAKESRGQAGGHQSGKGEGMRDPAVAKQVSVRNAVIKADYVDVRRDRACRPESPCPPLHSLRSEEWAES
jgi:hypothetical protein